MYNVTRYIYIYPVWEAYFKHTVVANDDYGIIPLGYEYMRACMKFRKYILDNGNHFQNLNITSVAFSPVDQAKLASYDGVAWSIVIIS